MWVFFTIISTSMLKIISLKKADCNSKPDFKEFANVKIHTIRVKHRFAKKCLRYDLPILINNTPKNIKDKVYTHSLPGFSTYIKKIYIEKYENLCQIRNCYVCNNN